MNGACHVSKAQPHILSWSKRILVFCVRRANSTRTEGISTRSNDPDPKMKKERTLAFLRDVPARVRAVQTRKVEAKTLEIVSRAGHEVPFNSKGGEMMRQWLG